MKNTESVKMQLLEGKTVRIEGHWCMKHTPRYDFDGQNVQLWRTSTVSNSKSCPDVEFWIMKLPVRNFILQLLRLCIILTFSSKFFCELIFFPELSCTIYICIPLMLDFKCFLNNYIIASSWHRDSGVNGGRMRFIFECFLKNWIWWTLEVKGKGFRQFLKCFRITKMLVFISIE